MRRTTISTFLVAAGLLVSGQAAWAQGPTVLSIDCGTDTPTAGWGLGNDYVTGGGNFTWGAGTWDVSHPDAAPEQVYYTVRHEAHSYDFPDVPDGDYIVRFHFCEAYGAGTVRAMDYTIEGVELITDLDPNSEAGGNYIALPWDVEVTISDGNGLQIEASWDTEVDVFEAGIEIILAVPPELDSIVVSPDIAYVRPGETVELTATPLDQYGDPFPATIDWVLSGGGTLSSATGDTTTFQSDGTEDTFTATATSGAFTDTASVHVAQPELTTITITPATKAIPLSGGSVVLTAEALDQYGDPVSPAVTIAWTIDIGGPTVTPDTGTTDAAGKHTTTFASDGTTEGAFTVTATSGAVSGTATVTVTEQPIVTTLTLSAPKYIIDGEVLETLTWTVLAKDQFGDPIGLVDVAFSIDPLGGTFDPTPVTTDAVNGIASTVFTPDGTSTGDFTVTASSGDVEVTATLKITGPPVLTSIEVTPPTAAIISGESVTLSARPLDQYGNVYATQVTWTVDSLDATLSPTTGGSTVFTSSAEGTYQVTATAGTDPDTVTDSATITVSPPVLTSVSITPDSATAEIKIPTNGTKEFEIATLDQSGNAIGATVDVAVDSGGTLDVTTGTIDPSANPTITTTFTSDGTVGTFTITATATKDAATVTHTVTVKVEAPVLTTVRVTPSGPEIDIEGTQDFSVATLDQFNTAITATVSWSVSGGGTLSDTTGGTTTFTSNGTVGDFTVTASATDGGVSVTDSTKITVLAELTGLGGGEGCVAGAPGLGLGVLLLLAAALAVARERRRAA